MMPVMVDMVETEMQATARYKDDRSFAMAHYFRDAHHSGQLLSPAEISVHLQKMIENRYLFEQVLSYD
ncbi:hypothetical protein [Paenibacillus paeoniae]|uniref:Uncharacterized protein n=1 Tax=Paenibacillus paeoniae TaxID=2292705 RepID=A0A371PML1_9BACL|nr:hypothetical protein [Paenibacillus paeoniae]REK77027.1 hypothetical protein DX130_08455 [Paenibacillus paeoniae]